MRLWEKDASERILMALKMDRRNLRISILEFWILSELQAEVRPRWERLDWQDEQR